MKRYLNKKYLTCIKSSHKSFLPIIVIPIVLFFLSLSVITIVILLLSGSRKYEDWPTIENMNTYLSEKDYDIHMDDKIILMDEEYKGSFLYAVKGENFVIGFNGNDIDTVNQVYELIGEVYGCDVIAMMGEYIYCGSNKGLKDAKVNLKYK